MRCASFLVSASVAAGLAAPGWEACRCAHDAAPARQADPAGGCCGFPQAPQPSHPADPDAAPHDGPCCCLAPADALPPGAPATLAPSHPQGDKVPVCDGAPGDLPSRRAHERLGPAIRPTILAPPPRGAPLFLLHRALLL